jgi:cytochrome b561/polyisoprenoid-binding protein YceI
MTTDTLPSDAAPAFQQRYTAVAIALHWAIALMIIGLIGVGWFMENMLGDAPADRAQYQTIVQLHKSFGITVLLLSVARIAWRIMNPPPKEPPMPGWQAMASRTVHVLFYILIIAMPLSGWIMASASGAFETRYFGTVDIRLPVIPTLDAGTREGLEDTFGSAHSLMAWTIVGLLVLHVAGALKHQFVDKDGLMARMAPGVFGRTAGPPDDGQGAFWAFGAAALVFAVVAGLSFSGAQPPAAPADGAQQAMQEQEPASNAPEWAVDYEKSKLAARFTYMGRPYEAVFPEWNAKIQLDTDAETNEHIPADGYVRVIIPVGKISTGEPYFDDSLSQGDWFDTGAHPEAVFEVKGGIYKLTERDYEATGVLQMKGQSLPVRLPFTLDIAGTTATMHGEVTLKRRDLGVGGATPTEPAGDAEWVADDVVVVIDIVATRQ